MRYWGWVIALILAGYGCGSNQGDDCGAGEELRDGACVAVGTCGSGTRLENGVCSVVAGGASGEGDGGGGGREESGGALSGVAGNGVGGGNGETETGGGDGGRGSVDAVGGAAAGSAGADDGEAGAGGSSAGGDCAYDRANDSLSAVTFQIDPAHTGGQPLSSLHAPLKRCWSRSFGSVALSYPLIAKGRVFFTSSSLSGARLYALSASNGQTLWGPIDLGSSSFGSVADVALDGDKLFTVNGTALVSAFNAATGAPIWSRSLGLDTSPGAPVAAGGILYVVVSETLRALDEDTGALLWSAAPGGSPTSVAYTPSLLILQFIEKDVSGLDPMLGSSLWHNKGCCSGGGGNVPVIYQGRIYETDSGNHQILDSKGTLLGSFNANTIAVPAFENDLGFFLASSTLEAHDPNGKVKWSFAGDQKLASTPLAAGGLVYQGSSAGKLYALDELTGQIAWQDDVGAPIPVANQSYGSKPVTGLAASKQLLIVPTSTGVVAYGN